MTRNILIIVIVIAVCTVGVVSYYEFKLARYRNLIDSVSILNQEMNFRNSQLKKEIEGLTMKSENLEIHNYTNEVFDEIERIKNLMIEKSGGLNEIGIPKGKNNQDISEIICNSSNPFYSSNLKMGMKKLQSLYKKSECLNSDRIQYEVIEDFFTGENERISWEYSISKNLPLNTVLCYLTMLQNKILSNEIILLDCDDNMVK